MNAKLTKRSIGTGDLTTNREILFSVLNDQKAESVLDHEVKSSLSTDRWPLGMEGSVQICSLLGKSSTVKAL